MRSTLSLLIVLLLASPFGCSSTGDQPSTGDNLALVVPHTGEDCVCGSPEADRVGCYCEDCLLRGGNPQNPDCMCLPLAPRAAAPDAMQTSLGGGASGGLVGFDSLVLERGGRVSGLVLDDTGEKVLFRHEDGREEEYAYDQLSTRSIYRLLQAQTDREDGPAEFRLATYALDIGLYAHSRRHFGFALEADPTLEDDVKEAIALLDQAAADQELAEARSDFEAGREKDAREHLQTIVTEYPEARAAGGARSLLQDLEGRREVRAAAEADEAHSEAVAKAIEPAKKRLEKARKYNNDGLMAKSQASSIRAYEHAVLEGERCERDIARSRKREGGSSDVMQALNSVDGQRKDLLGSVNLNLASVYMVRTDYRNALQATNAAIALDPDNKRAQQMRARIETEANDWWRNDSPAYGYRAGYYGGGIVVGRRRGVGTRIGYGGGMRGGMRGGGGMRLR